MVFRPRVKTTHAINPLARMIWDGGGSGQFEPEEVPDEELLTILTLAIQAPSRFNLQPWRFVLVREQEQRDRLSRAVVDCAAVCEAPVVVVAYGVRGSTPAHTADATGLPREQEDAVWLTRHVMTAFSYLMIAAEALGWNTAPMEDFNAAAVRAVLDLPADAEVVALLAIGRRCDPPPSIQERLPLEAVVSAERHGVPWGDPCLARS